MRHVIVAVRDEKAGVFYGPFPHRAFGAAARWFSDIINSGETDWGKHPSDYELVHLGYWDDVSGVYENVSVKVLATGSAVVAGVDGGIGLVKEG